ncbi:hypothetical protein [Sulfuriroseicoccus oceanibius]|uniref:Uncharacterized protein n=1 Tax=Sulfuriroseicoccus oceanibius TaxID=2707525 RepID=A0A6B3LFC1_9BACT|nr:hypothetical protein [Sulfuriroseicoccus oceanibius]QQL45203.1 hypothetical protein G3M56_001030 [Sulfuriroseicoccus oceanibius]
MPVTETPPSPATSFKPRYGRVLAVVRDGKITPLADQGATPSADAPAQSTRTPGPPVASPKATTPDDVTQESKPAPSTEAAPATRRKVTHRTVPLDEATASRPAFKRTADRAPSEREEAATKNAKGPQFLHPGKLRFGAALYVIGKVSIYSTILLTCYFAATGLKHPVLMVALPAIALVFVIWGWIAAASLRCRVCTMPFMRKQKCKMSPKAPKFPLASHQFTFAVHTLCHNNPRCPYCGTVNRLRK